MAGTQRAPSVRPSGLPKLANPVLGLQRAIGNQATTAMFVQREFNDNADDFVKWMLADSTFGGNSIGEEGACSDAAKAIGALLKEKGIAHIYRGILGFPPNTHRTLLNRNHFVVVATVDGKRIVIDPTQGQFQGGGPQVAAESDWVSHFKTLKVRVVVPEEAHLTFEFKYVDGATFEEVNEFAKKRGARKASVGGTDL
jgi:hypothetical protein